MVTGIVTFLCLVPAVCAVSMGINYGRLGDNLPPPSEVVRLFHSLSVSRTKLYNADPDVIEAFSGTGISLILGIGNEYLSGMSADPANASEWVRNHILPFYPSTLIVGITVGNEVLSSNDTNLMEYLLPAILNLHVALGSVTIPISTPHSLAILSTSYPPSAGSFQEDLASKYIVPLLGFLSQTGSPFMINAYPYFAYKSDPENVPLDYVLFEPNPGVSDPNTGLRYHNMFDAQIDSVYSALKSLGYPNVELLVSETGWPTAGDLDEAGANPLNAQKYNGNLVQRLVSNKWTPLRPDRPLETYLFALFNENLKPGPTSERNYGLFNADGTKVYDLATIQMGPPYSYSTSSSSPFYLSLKTLGLLSTLALLLCSQDVLPRPQKHFC